MKLAQEEIKNIIPHRDPMLLVSTVEEMIPGERIVSTFWVDPDREIFKGHFPGEPVLPGVYSVECMAQTADYSAAVHGSVRWKGAAVPWDQQRALPAKDPAGRHAGDPRKACV